MQIRPGNLEQHKKIAAVVAAAVSEGNTKIGCRACRVQIMFIIQTINASKIFRLECGQNFIIVLSII